MLVSGLVIMAFVVYHLLHYTVQLTPVNGVKGGLDFHSLTTRLADGTQVQDVYAMMVHGFQVGWVSLFYLIAQALLFVHLPVVLGYASIPVAVLTGMGGDYVKNLTKAPTTNTETLR